MERKGREYGIERYSHAITVSIGKLHQLARKNFNQTKGTPMASPLSPLLAEVFLQDMENKLLPTIPHIKSWFRMVDDVFCVIRKRKEEDVLLILNSYHPSLKFTIEKKANSAINFLDVTITRKEDGTIGRSVFRKATHRKLPL